METLTVQVFFCVFEGATCSHCRKSIDPKERKLAPSDLRRHMARHAADGIEMSNQQAQQVVANLTSTAQTFADALATCSTDEERVELFTYYLNAEPTQAVVWCNECDRGYKPWKRHSKNTRRAHGETAVRNVSAWSSSVSTTNPTKYFRQDELNAAVFTARCSNFLKFFLKVPAPSPVHFPVLQNRVIEHLPLSIRAGIDVVNFARSALSPQNMLRPQNTSYMPLDAGYLVDSALANADEQNFGTLLPEHHDDFAAIYERQHIALDNGDQIELLQFENDIGIRRAVVDHFQGSYAKFAFFASQRLAPAAADGYEAKMVYVLARFREITNEQASMVHPDIRHTVMMIGDGNQHSNLRQIKEAVEEVMNDAPDELAEEDQGELPVQSMSKDDMEKALRRINTILEDRGSANGGRRYFRTLTSKSLNRYFWVAKAFLLFFTRHIEAMDPDDNKIAKYWHMIAKPKIESFDTSNENDGLSSDHPAFTVVMKLFLMALSLDADTMDYSNQIQLKHGVVRLFILCSAVHLPENAVASLLEGQLVDGNLEENTFETTSGSVILRSTSPYRTHESCSQLFHALRLCFVSAMVHACKRNDQAMQKVLHSSSVFSQCSVVRDLGLLAQIARKYESKVHTGTPRAHPLVVDDGKVFAWEIPALNSPVAGAMLRITLTQISAGAKLLTNDNEDCLRKLVLELANPDHWDARKAISRRNNLSKMNQAAFVDKLLTAMFGRQVHFVQDGSEISFDIDVYVSERGGSAKRRRAKAKGSTIGAQLFLPNDDSIQAPDLLVDSNSIANSIAEICALPEEHELRELVDSVASRMLTNCLSKKKCSLRGQPRNCDLNGMKCGSTNVYGTPWTSDVTAAPSVGGADRDNGSYTDRICVRFKSTKFSGGVERRHPFVFLPEEVGRMFGLYLAIVRASQVYYIIGQDLNKVDFGKASGVFHPSVGHNRAMLINAMTKLTMDIRVSGERIIAKPSYNWDHKVQRATEKAFCLGDGELNDRIYRMLWASVVICLNKQYKFVKNVGNVDVFCHTEKIESNSSQGPTTVASPHVEETFCLDTSFAEVLGISGYDFEPSRTSASLQCQRSNPYCLLPPERALRIFGPTEALGLYRFAGSLDFGQRDYSQTRIASEVVTGARDAQFTIMCGDGKTIAVWTMIAYPYAKIIALLDEISTRVSLLAQLLSTRYTGTAHKSEFDFEKQAYEILEDLYVRALLRFAAGNESRDRNGVCLVVVPTIPLRTAMEQDLNALSLVQAQMMSSETDECVCAKLKQYRDSNRQTDPWVNVLVATSAYVASPRIANIVSHLCKKWRLDPPCS